MARNPRDRVLAIVDQINRHMLANEKLCRTAIRHYNDAWLTAERTGEPNPSLAREGRRKRWIATSLEALRGTIPDDDLPRLEAALCLVAGGEAITVLRASAISNPTTYRRHPLGRRSHPHRRNPRRAAPSGQPATRRTAR